MKRMWLCALACVLLSGCRGGVPYAREMGDMALLRTLGVDREGIGVRLTASTAGRAGEEALTLSAQGETVSAAALAMRSMGERYVYYGYVDRLLLGEELAVVGIQDVIDHLARDPELGLGARLWVIRGATAEQVVGSAGGNGISERLGQLDTDSRLGAANITCTAAELMSVLAREGSACLPALEWVPAREGDGGEETGVLLPNGYGMVRQGKLVCWVEQEAARGIELLKERAFGHVEVLTLKDGAKVSLEVEEVNAKVSPVFRGEELTGIEVVCRVCTRVAQTGRRLWEEELEGLEFQLELLEGERIVQAVEQSQYWDADCLDLKRRAQLSCPSEKAALEEQWDERFRTLDVRVDVRAQVERSFGVMEEVG